VIKLRAQKQLSRQTKRKLTRYDTQVCGHAVAIQARRINHNIDTKESDMETVLVAIITAIVSITVALIQASLALRLARLKEQPVQQAASVVTPTPQVKPLSLDRLWLWISGMLIASNLLWQLYLPNESSFIIHLGAIPWCTCLLAYFRPIRWGYVAGVVTLISIIAVVTFYLVGGNHELNVLRILAFLFIFNAILAAGIAYLRQRNPART